MEGGIIHSMRKKRFEGAVMAFLVAIESHDVATVFFFVFVSRLGQETTREEAPTLKFEY